MKTRIIIDSTADMTPEIKLRVYTVPLTVHFGREEYSAKRWRSRCFTVAPASWAVTMCVRILIKWILRG